MPRYCPRCGESLHSDSRITAEVPRTPLRSSKKPGPRTTGIKKRGPSAYNKKYAKAYKALKKKHPRMSFASLAKKAHKAVKK